MMMSNEPILLHKYHSAPFHFNKGYIPPTRLQTNVLCNLISVQQVCIIDEEFEQPKFVMDK